MAGLVTLSGRHPLQPLYLQSNPLPLPFPLPLPHSLARPVSRLQGSEGSDDGSPASPGGTISPPPLSPGQAAQGLEQLLDTPTRKNKRKLSEPRKRSGSDFSIRRLCRGSPGDDGEEEEEMSDSSEDGEEDKNDDYRRRVLGKVGNRSSSSGAGESSSFIVGSSNNNSNSGSGNQLPHKEGSRKSAGRRQRERPGQRSRAAAKRRRSPRERDDSSSRGPSEREDTPVSLRLSGLTGAGVAGATNGLPITNGLRLPRLPHPAPFFPSGLPPAATALGFLPGFYLGPDGRPAGYPPATFPGLPLGLTHNPMAFAAASSSTSADLDQHGRIPALRGEHGLPPFPGHAYGLPHLVGPGAGGSELKAQDLSSRAESPDNSGDDNSSTNDGGGEGGSGEGGEGGSSGGGGRKPRKNYKNMTRERRVEANARERTRVHTISAAFDALRRAVPSYSYNQKLSKLAILRIACTYIMALARLADVDCSAEPSVPLTFADCVDLCTRTIQTEGRARRRH